MPVARWLLVPVLLLGAVSHSAATLFVVNGNSSSISALDPDSGAVLNTFASPEPTSGAPDGLGASADRLFFVNGFGTGRISVINPMTGVVDRQLTGPGATFDSLGFGSSSFGNTLFALDFNNDTILLLDPQTGNQLGSLDPGVELVGGLDFNARSGTLFVSDFSSTNLIYEIDPETGAILNSFPSPAASGTTFGIGFVGDRMFVSEVGTGRIFEVDPGTGAVLNVFDSPDEAPSGLAGSLLLDGINMLSSDTGATAASNVLTPTVLSQLTAILPNTVSRRISSQLFQLRARPGVGPTAPSALGVTPVVGRAAGGAPGVPWGGWVSAGSTFLDNDFPTTAFDTRTSNVMAGVDLQLTDNLLVGVALGVTNTDTDTEFNAGHQDVDAYTAIGYAGYLLSDIISVDASLGFTRSNIDQMRTLLGASIEGSTNSDRVFGAVNVNAFYPTGNWILSGRAGLLFAKDDVDEFVEQTGLPGGLVNPEQRFRIAQGRLGGDVGYSLGAWEPFVSAHLVHDFTRTAVQVGPGQRQPSEDDTEVELGFGVRYFDERHDVSGALEFISVQGRDDIDSQSVNLNVRVKF